MASEADARPLLVRSAKPSSPSLARKSAGVTCCAAAVGVRITYDGNDEDEHDHFALQNSADQRRSATKRRSAKPELSESAAKKSRRSAPRQNTAGARRSVTPTPASLTIENLLRNLVPQHASEVRREEDQLRSFSRDASDRLQIIRAERQIAAMKAAMELTPLNIARGDDDVVHSNLNIVIEHIGVARLPLETVIALIRRAAVTRCRAQRISAAEVWEIVRPSWSLPSPSHTQAPRSKFDPRQPRLRDAEISHSPSLLWSSAVEIIAEELLAALMIARDVAQITQLARIISELSPEGKYPTADLRRLCRGVAAMVQSTAIDSEQIAALVDMKAKKFILGEFIRPALDDPFWVDAMTRTWPRAAAESISAPLLEQTRRKFEGDREEVDSAWNLLTLKFEAWTAALRPEATAAVLLAAIAAAGRSVAGTLHLPASPEGQTLAETWRSRVAWLLHHGPADSRPTLQQHARALEEWLRSSTAEIRLSEGLRLLPALTGDNVAPETTDAAAAAFEGCRGLKCCAPHAENIAAALERLERLDMTASIAKLAISLLEARRSEVRGTRRAGRSSHAHSD